MTYTLRDDLTAITCHVCGRTSYNIQDVRERYCGFCHQFHDVSEEKKTRIDIVTGRTKMICPNCHTAHDAVTGVGSTPDQCREPNALIICYDCGQVNRMEVGALVKVSRKELRAMRAVADLHTKRLFEAALKTAREHARKKGKHA